MARKETAEALRAQIKTLEREIERLEKPIEKLRGKRTGLYDKLRALNPPPTQPLQPRTMIFGTKKRVIPVGFMDSLRNLTESEKHEAMKKTLNLKDSDFAEGADE